MTETAGSNGVQIIDWALKYALDFKWNVFPVHGIRPDGMCTCGKAHDAEGDKDKGKHPVLKNGVKGATTDEKQIREWWGNEAGADWNIGIETGQRSNLTVIDIDIGPGKEGDTTWLALNAEKGEPDTLAAITGSGGMHFFFQYNSALNTSSNTLGPGVDCRNDNGYVVGAPSLHRSGDRYRWADDFDALAAESLPKLLPLPAHLAKRVETRGRKKGDAHKHKKYTLEQVKAMLDVIDASDRDMWRNVGVILGREFAQSDEAFALYNEWSNTWGGEKGRNHDEHMRDAFYKFSVTAPGGTGKELSLATIIGKALDGGWIPDPGVIDRNEFIFYAPDNKFYYVSVGSFWIADAVNALVGLVKDDAGNLIKASSWIQRNMFATSMAKDPGLADLHIKDHDARDGYVYAHHGAAVINTYRGTDLTAGDARLAGPFIEHVRKVFPKPGDADQFFDYMAHRVQHPEEKPRFALLIAGEMGTGKDTAIEFCIPAIGHWNISNIEPAELDLNYNSYVASTLIRISEAANLHEMNKWAFNERIKVLIAGNPDTIRVNPKYAPQFDVRMYCGVIITTNHLATGIYIPEGDRRYDVIECATRAEMGIAKDDDRKEYFDDLWQWFKKEDGASHVYAFLGERDIAKFSASSGQRKTAAHKAVVQAGMASDDWFGDGLDKMPNKQIFRLDNLVQAIVAAGDMTKKELTGPKLTNVLTRAGYVKVICPDSKDGRWTMNDGTKSTVWCEVTFSIIDAMRMARSLKATF